MISSRKRGARVLLSIPSLGLTIVLVCLIFAAWNILTKVLPSPKISVIQGLVTKHSTRSQLEEDAIITMFPFTQYGPNVQLYGAIQTFALCEYLKVRCIEPGFSSLFASEKMTLSDVFNLSTVTGVNITSRNASASSPLSPFYILFFRKPGGPACIPSPIYWELHGIKPSKKTRTMIINSTRVTAESQVISTISEIIREARNNNEANQVVALVYCDAFPSEMSLPEMHKSFNRIRHTLQPVRTLEDLANEAMEDVGLPLNGDYIAIHLRLRDHCNTSLAECCCETSGSYTELNEHKLDELLASIIRSSGNKKVFIAAPPSFKKMEVNWTLTDEKALVTWYSSDSPGSLSESVVQQIICKRATSFFYSVEESTWSQSVAAWRKSDAGQNLLKALDVPDLQENDRFLPRELEARVQRAESDGIQPHGALQFLSSSTCDVDQTVFVALRDDGFGASLHFVLLAAGFAAKYNFTLVPLPLHNNKPWSWSKHCSVDKDTGGQHSWNCLFRALHICTTFSWNSTQYTFDEMSSKVQTSWQGDEPCVAPMCFTFPRASKFFDFNTSLYAVSFGIKVPSQQSVIHRGKLINMLLSPSSQTVDQLAVINVTRHAYRSHSSGLERANLSAAQFWNEVSLLHKENSLLLGLHVRRGDSCNDPRQIRRCFDVSDYVAAILDMKQAYNLSAIYLATDEAKFAEELSHTLAGTDIYTQNFDRQLYHSSNQSSYKDDNIPKKMQNIGPELTSYMTYGALFDWYALREADAFVGTFTSDFGRIGFELMSARTESVPPFVSLEGTYCKSRKPGPRKPVVANRIVNTCY